MLLVSSNVYNITRMFDMRSNFHIFGINIRPMREVILRIEFIFLTQIDFSLYIHISHSGCDSKKPSEILKGYREIEISIFEWQKWKILIISEGKKGKELCKAIFHFP